MLNSIREWIGKRRALRRLWQSDARALLQQDERNAYYNAQRLAARCRARGDQMSFFHWAKVASEIARLSPNAKMDMTVVQAIVDEEMRGHRP